MHDQSGRSLHGAQSEVTTGGGGCHKYNERGKAGTALAQSITMSGVRATIGMNFKRAAPQQHRH
eukprot:6204918-Lingulodinium_polyedra.AAC.1